MGHCLPFPPWTFSESFWQVCYCTTTAITFCLNIWLIKCHMSTAILYFLSFNQLECLDPTKWYAIICFIQCSDHATNELICIWHLFQFKIISKANTSSEHILINNMVSYTYWKYIVMFEGTVSLRTHKIKCKKKKKYTNVRILPRPDLMLCFFHFRSSKPTEGLTWGVQGLLLLKVNV